MRDSEHPEVTRAKSGTHGSRLDRWDALIAVALGALYLALLLGSVKTLGYARDEGFYFHAARAIEGWLELVATLGSEAFEQTRVDAYFGVNHEHPVLMKGLFALSHRFLYERWSLFAEEGTAYRFPGMCMAALALGVIYVWGRQLQGRAAGLVAALLFALMPRVFYHAHLACFDVPVASLWLVTSYAYFRAFAERKLGWASATGVLYGLLLDTKHNSWLLPFALIAHLAVVRWAERAHGLPRRGPFVPWALVALFVLGPLVFFTLWPWIWFDTFERLGEYARFHLGHEYYNMEFLGRTYWQPPMPRSYAWIMTSATVPAVTLLLFVLGAFDSVRHALGRYGALFLARFRRGGASATSVAAPVNAERLSADALWIIGLCVSYAPWLSTNTPIFGGTKHWLTAYPFLCLLAGHGFALAVRRIAALRPAWQARPTRVAGAVAAACLLGPLVMTLHSHPWGLSFYTPLVGGAPGAATLGLNRTFWGYTTGALTEELNVRAAGGAFVYVHDTALQSWDMLQRDGRVRRELRGTLAIHGSRLALYHHEPHMRRVEYQIWVDYGTRAPATVGVYDGVPIVLLYERPRR